MSTTLYRTGLVAQALLYAAAGANHFLHPKPYLTIMPPHYSHPAAWVQFTGAAEIAGALGLLCPPVRRAAAWGLIAMLVGYFDVHLHMLEHADRFASIPKWALEARIPIQFVLIAWAYAYARKQAPAS